MQLQIDLIYFQYDEVLPETMTTKLGGFYINSGRLELKEMSDSSEDEFRSPLPVKKNKKRVIRQNL
jgi:ubinuclein